MEIDEQSKNIPSEEEPSAEIMKSAPVEEEQ